jgi:hypothetical protein
MLIWLTDVCVDSIGGGPKGQTMYSETKRILDMLFRIDLHVVENECNRVAKSYRNVWNAKNPSDHMIKEYLPNLTYREGVKELYPDFLLTAPSTVHVRIFDLYMDTLNSEYAPNHDAAAGVLPHPSDPILMIFLPTLEVEGLKITWRHRPSTTFRSIIIHEFLHLCGEVKTPQRDIIDGVIRHTMVGREAIEPLICAQEKYWSFGVE